MTGLAAVRERALALFFLALLAFSPALLVVFSRHAFLFGVPLLYVYLFGVWGVVILCIGLNAFPRDNAPPNTPPTAPTDAPAANTPSNNRVG